MSSRLTSTLNTDPSRCWAVGHPASSIPVASRSFRRAHRRRSDDGLQARDVTEFPQQRCADSALVLVVRDHRGDLSLTGLMLHLDVVRHADQLPGFECAERDDPCRRRGQRQRPLADVGRMHREEPQIPLLGAQRRLKRDNRVVISGEQRRIVTAAPSRSVVVVVKSSGGVRAVTWTPP